MTKNSIIYMKKIIFTILAVITLSPIGVLAQGKYGADSANCIKYLSYYKEYFKQKSYDEALPNWRKAYSSCPPSANQYILLDGSTLMRRLIIKNANNKEYKKQLIDTLLTLHDLRVQYYPKYAVTARNNKGIDMNNFITDDPQRLYDGYSEIIAANKTNTNPTLYLYNFSAALDLFKAGKLDSEKILELYEEMNSGLEKVKVDTETDKEKLEKVKEDLQTLFVTSKIASCEQLIALFTPRYEADPDNLELVSNIVRLMNTSEGCIDNDLYLNAVTSMHKLNPNSNSAYFLYKLNAARNNAEDAVKYLEEAIASEETDELKDGEYLYELATYCYKTGQVVKSYNLAQKAASLNPDFAGKSYFLMGTIWTGLPCSGNEIDKSARYWVACDWFNKAKAADPSLAEESNKLINFCAGYFPQKAEAFMYDILDGQSYSVSCGGLSATTVVRTKK